MRRTRRWLAWMLAGLTAWPLSGVVAAHGLTRRAQARVTEEVAPPGWRGLRLTADDGVTLGAWWSAAVDAPIGVVVAHGNGGARSRLDGTLDRLREARCDVLAVSLRAHGDSDGERNDLGWSARLDVAAAVRALEDAAPARPIVLVGFSLGAAASVLAASEVGELVDGYVLVGPYADLRDAVRRRTDRYLPFGVAQAAYGALRLGATLVLPELDRLRPAAAAAALPPEVPVLVLFGGDDDRAPRSDAEAFVSAHAGTRAVELPGLDHEDLGAALDTPTGHAALIELLDAVAR